MRPLEVAEMITGTATPEAQSPHGTDSFETLSRREWLSANGIGGFASGTVSGASERRYHAVLVAALDPPLGAYDAGRQGRGDRHDSG